jgi:hypothetical protein
MITRDPPRFVLVSQALARRAGTLLLLTVAGGGLLAGCGDSGDSSDNDPFAEYEGVWAVDKDDSVIDCPTEVDLHNQAFSIWNSSFTIAAGVLADIAEIQGSCQLNYDVDVTNHVATLKNPDPYTNAAPTCELTIDASTGEKIVLKPVTDGGSAWTFQLLQPTAGEAPPAQIVGSADVVLMLADALGNLQTLNCKFAPHVDAHKIAKP